VVASREYGRRFADCREDPTDELPEPCPLLVDPLHEGVLHSEQAAWVLAVLDLLPPRQRQVLAWHYDGYPPSQIADILRITPANARVALHHARETLRSYLASEGRNDVHHVD
jgi:RNA polymerase sigma-70 factor (ECF subfamily)